jgi:hypothetical protein
MIGPFVHADSFLSTLRYAHLAPSHLRAGIQALEQRTSRHLAGSALSPEPRVTPVSREIAEIV